MTSHTRFILTKILILKICGETCHWISIVLIIHIDYHAPVNYLSQLFYSIDQISSTIIINHFMLIRFNNAIAMVGSVWAVCCEWCMHLVTNCGEVKLWVDRFMDSGILVLHYIRIIIM